MMRSLVIMFGGSCLVLLSLGWDVRGGRSRLLCFPFVVCGVCAARRCLFTLPLDAIDGLISVIVALSGHLLYYYSRCSRSPFVHMIRQTSTLGNNMGIS